MEYIHRLRYPPSKYKMYFITYPIRPWEIDDAFLDTKTNCIQEIIVEGKLVLSSKQCRNMTKRQINEFVNNYFRKLKLSQI